MPASPTGCLQGGSSHPVPRKQHPRAHPAPAPHPRGMHGHRQGDAMTQGGCSGSPDAHPGGEISCGPRRDAGARRNTPAPACPGDTPGAGGRTAGSPAATACCAAVVTRGWVGVGDTGGTQPWPPTHTPHWLLSGVGGSAQPTAPHPRPLAPSRAPRQAPCPHRHHVVLQLLQPRAALVAAAAGSGQAVVGSVEGGRGGTAVICFEGFMGAVAAEGWGSAGPGTPRVPACPPMLHSTHHRAGLGHLCSRDRHPPWGRGTHPGAGAPCGSQTHKELQQLKSAS